MLRVEEERIFTTSNNCICIYILLLNDYEWLVLRNFGPIGGTIENTMRQSFNSYIEAMDFFEKYIATFKRQKEAYDVKNGEAEIPLHNPWLNLNTSLDYISYKPGFSNKFYPKGRHIFDRKMYEYYAWPETTTWIFTLAYENEQFYVYIQYGSSKKLYSYLRYVSPSFHDASYEMHSIIARNHTDLEKFNDFNEVQNPGRKWIYEQMINCQSNLASINKAQAVYNDIKSNGGLFEVICINNKGLENNFQPFVHYYAEPLDNNLFTVQDDNGNQIECMQERFERM